MIDKFKYVCSEIWADKRMRYLLLASLLIVIFMVFLTMESTTEIKTVNEILDPPTTEEWVPMVPPTDEAFKDSIAICLNEYLGIDSFDDYPQMNDQEIVIYGKALAKDPGIQKCIDNQNTAAVIIRKGWIETIETMVDKGGGTDLKMMVLVCHAENTNPQGIINFVETLKCLSKTLKQAREDLDEKIKRRTAI